MIRARSAVPACIAVGIVLVGCDDPAGPGRTRLPDVVSAAVIDTAGSIFRSLDVVLDGPGAVEVFYTPQEGGPVFRMSADSSAARHDILLPRLRELTTYEYAARAIDGTRTADSIVRGTFTTGSIPDEVKDFEYALDGDATFPLLMIPIRTGTWTGQIAMETRDGSIVWFRGSGGGTLVAAPVPGSHDMIYIDNGFPGDPGNSGIVRVDPRRQVVAKLTQDATSPFGRIHHDMTTIDHERVLFIAYDTQTVRDTVVNGEAIWEWNMTTNAVEKRWSSWDFYDWDTERDPTASPSAWLHANSIDVGARGNVIVSFRTFSQIISIAPDFQSIEWRLGGPGETLGIATDDRFRNQHAASEVAPDRILLFDNRGGSPADDRTRILELRIEDDTAYATMDYTPDPPLLAAVRGGTYRLENGNTVSTFTGLPFAMHETTPDGSVVWSMSGDQRLTNVFRVIPWPSIAGEVEVDAMP